MKYIGMLIIVASLPAFLKLMQTSARNRYCAFVALGALPILSSGLNVDIAFYDIARWPGHTKGIIVSLTDTLAMAITLHYSKTRPSKFFSVIWILYIALHIPGVFVDNYSTAALSYIWNLVRGFIYFLACSAVIKQNGLRPLILGLAASVIVNGADAIKNAAAGQAQASGLLGHRNYSGLVTNLAVPTLLASLLSWRKAWLPAIGLAFAAIGAALGGSRASIVLISASFVFTLGVASLLHRNRRLMLVTAITIVGALVMVPTVAYKMNQRFQNTGESFSFDEDGERLAFKRASELMNQDYPYGVGLNNYAVKSNAEGYAAKAGVTWATIANTAIVHDSYVLIRTEGGYVALVGVIIMLGSIIGVSAFISVNRTNSHAKRLYASAVFISIIVLSVHLKYEWALVRIHVIYGLAFLTALIGSILQSHSIRRHPPSRRATLN